MVVRALDAGQTAGPLDDNVHQIRGNNEQANAADLQDQLASLYAENLSVISVEPMGISNDAHQTLSTVKRLRIRHADGRVEQLVMREPREGPYGLEELEDRARQCLLGFRSFGATDGHPEARAVGMVDEAGKVVSLAGGQRFFLLEEFVEGENYGDGDFCRMKGGEVPEREWSRAAGFARYLAVLHGKEPESGGLTRYRRSLREVVGGGEGLMGVIDSFPTAFVNEHRDRLSRLEQTCLSALQTLRDREHRLRVVHGDFHPWNILFRGEEDFTAIDRSRCLLHDPAIDVGAMLMSYLVLAIRQGGDAPPALGLARRFLSTYLERADDPEILETLPLYTAMRGAAAASPCFYPDMPKATRLAVFDLAIAIAEMAAIDAGLEAIAAAMPSRSGAIGETA